MKNLTAKQITKRLEKLNMSLDNLEISNNEIEVCVGYTERNGFGMCDDAKTKRLANKIKKIFPECSWSNNTQYGAIILHFNFKKCDLVANNID